MTSTMKKSKPGQSHAETNLQLNDEARTKLSQMLMQSSTMSKEKAVKLWFCLK